MVKAEGETLSGTEMTAMLSTLPWEIVHQIFEFLPLKMILDSDPYNQEKSHRLTACSGAKNEAYAKALYFHLSILTYRSLRSVTSMRSILRDLYLL